MPLLSLPTIRFRHPDFETHELEWIRPGASAIWTDRTGKEHHVTIAGTVGVEEKDFGKTAAEVLITFYRDEHHRNERTSWPVLAASVKPDRLGNLLSAISLGNLDKDGYLKVKLSEQDLNGLEAIIRLARDERTAGALDRIVVIADSILRRYRQQCGEIPGP